MRFLDEVRLTQDVSPGSEAQGIAGGPFSATDIRAIADMGDRAGGALGES